MSLGTPYTACAGTQAAGSATFQVTLTHNVAIGDAVVVAISSNNNSTAAPTGVTDSAGNTYTQKILDTTRTPNLGVYECSSSVAAMASGVGWIKGAFAGTATIKNLIARGCSGVLASSPVDVAIVADAGVGASPSSGSSGTLAQPLEWAVAALTNGATGGTPSNWTGGFTAVVTEGSGPFLTMADQIVSAQTALTAGATIVSSTWEMALVTLKGAVSTAGTDTGSGTEGGDTKVTAQAATDTATGTEGTPSAGIAGADTGTGTEAAQLALSSADSAAAADAATRLALSGADSATATEAAGLALVSADAATATEAAGLAVTSPDTGTFTDAALLELASADSATGLDAALLELVSSDAFSGAEDGYFSGPVFGADAGSFTDDEIPPATVQTVVLGMDVDTQVTGVQVLTVVSGQP